LVGWGYILGITFAVKDIPYLLSTDNEAGGYAIAEVFYLAFKSRYGNGVGGIICLGIVAVAIYFCGMSSVTSNSRMAYAFSRDGAMPFSSVWHKVNNQEVPINAVWLSVSVALCMALPSLGSHQSPCSGWPPSPCSSRCPSPTRSPRTHAQLHPRRRWGPLLPRALVVAAQRQELVQGPRHQPRRMN
ncbi:unnamed protein product, partial [Urochloa humidicola]